MEIDPVILALFGPAPSDLDLSEDPAKSNSALVAVLFVIAACAVVLRFASRRIADTPLQKDDYAIVVALLFTGGSAGMSFGVGRFGAGKHVWAVTARDLSTASKLLFAHTYIFAAAVTFTKISVLLLYKRIFVTGTLSFSICIWTAGVITCAYPLTLAIGMANCCKPVSFYWTRFAGNTEGSCPLDVGTFFVALAIINVFLDAFILAIPIPQIVRLQMSTRKKISICGLMLLGSFVCCASCVRIYYLHEFATATDMTSLMGPASVWSAIEPSIGILSACLPNMRPLYIISRRKSSPSYAAQKSHSNQDPPSVPGLMTWGRGDPKKSNHKKDGFTQVQDEDEMHLTGPEVPLKCLVSSGASNADMYVDGIKVRSEVHVQHDSGNSLPKG
ncbi:hypothetical protein PFICI_09021 [Pestalotiopsis fici W106-1]|uniref:Rhodopsin domain-containing protein n=1 Tax=Pestalotiopsis fici (strain W106-1 / CGMCC3.15140) TaxID=1229662 RepID=W3WZ76_PESFW|nr:uncharacterized protein PFICI_09021 [Pestalotiopsis fici W106-1]ETS79168.1 hypothetical protein PFICI_09021 [Pestalotiopsis fici W106-1]